MTTARELPVRLDMAAIAAFCRARGISRLSLFGSVLRSDFDPIRSDVDVLAEFRPGALDHVGLGVCAVWTYVVRDLRPPRRPGYKSTPMAARDPREGSAADLCRNVIRAVHRIDQFSDRIVQPGLLSISHSSSDVVAIGVAYGCPNMDNVDVTPMK